MKPMARRILLPTLAPLTAGAAVALLLAAPAQAQNLSANGLHPAVEAPLNTAPKPAPPPAIPGARANPASVAPPQRPPSDMQPTDALFDAINRGDLNAARDALNRGADLYGHNVLGMTPLELSVDLGRNDISFLLLSMRGEDEPSGPPASNTAAALPPAPPPARYARGRRGRERAVPVAASAPGAPVAQAAPVAQGGQRQGAPQQAQLFAGDGGTPVPQAGFLGFDSSRRTPPQ